jgi:peptidoglycan/LPS O-acetylase OafA/YrhL
MEGLAYASWLFTPTRLDGLAIGALIALLHKYHSAVLQRWAPRAFAVALVATFPVFFWLSDIFFTSHPKRLLELAAVMGPFLFSLLFGSLVATLVSDNHKRRPTGEGRLLLTTVARYSYGMYAFHVPIMVILFHTGRVQQTLAIHGYDFPYRAIYSMVILGLSYVAGFLSWELYEKKVLQHAPRYRYSAPVLIPPPERLQALPVQ